MRYISLGEARPGMCLAQELYDSCGRTLIGSNRELTEGYIKRLTEYGFDGIYINDEFSEGIEIESIITPQLRQEGLSCIRQHNIDGCYDVAKRMVEQILSRESLTLDLTDLRSYDDYTYAHSVNVAVCSCLIGIGMGLAEKELVNLVMAGLLHDFGKLQIPPEIVNKPGRLTQEEYQVMKSHPTLSYEQIRERWDISAQIKVAVLFHHENVDGSGYPKGFTGEEQTLFTKILHVADVYDALVSKRPYKKPYSRHEASEYLMGNCGIMFERQVVEALLSYVPLYPKGTEVVLSDGRIGIVYENAELHNLRPVIRLLDGTVLDMMQQENLHLTLDTRQEEYEISPEESEKARMEMIKPIKR